MLATALYRHSRLQKLAMRNGRECHSRRAIRPKRPNESTNSYLYAFAVCKFQSYDDLVFTAHEKEWG